MPARARIAKPRWGWSGAATRRSLELPAAAAERLLRLLSSYRTPAGEFAKELADLGAKYLRYLCQDELGPIRAEQLAALRELKAALDLLLLAMRLPECTRVCLCGTLGSPAMGEHLNRCGFDAYVADISAVREIAEAACLLKRPDQARDSAEVGRRDLVHVAEHATRLLDLLDTRSAELLLDQLHAPGLQAPKDADALAMCIARIKRLLWRVERGLACLEPRRGPDPAKSLKWLVWQLCEIYTRETGLPATSNAIVDYQYTGYPQSTAGRFVLACARAVLSSATWLQEHGRSDRVKRHCTAGPRLLKSLAQKEGDGDD
jgi:hypothetical protein